MMKSYSDFCNTEWTKVWDVNIVEFFSTVAFIGEYKKRESEYIKKLYRKK